MKIKGALFRCGRCRKTYSNPFGHVCVTRLDRQVAGSLDTFASQLRGIAMPSGRAQTADAALAASVSRTAGIFAGLGAATSATQYIGIANAAGLQQSVNQLNQDYTNLSNALRS